MLQTYYVDDLALYLWISEISLHLKEGLVAKPE
jgi:hypothetical protein